MTEHWDVIVVGSGPGGSAVAARLARAGRKVAALERGDYLPRETENWDPEEVFALGRYQAQEVWKDGRGGTFRPGLHDFVGGNSKVYGGVLFRLRESDFEETRHEDGLSPAWPLGYQAFEPFYAEAEALCSVHGARGEDPTEPPASGAYPFAPVGHEPRIQELSDALAREGHRPFHLPVGILLEEEGTTALPHSPCIRCDRFDGYPCPTNGKADAQVACLDPALGDCPNLALMTRTNAERIVTDRTGRRTVGVEVGQGDQARTLTSDVLVVACGALSSALLFLRSASDVHPHGLANGSGLVGRNYMRHNNSMVLAVSRNPNPTRFQKTLGLNDFYQAPERGGKGGWDYPLGHVQMVGKSNGRQVKAEATAALQAAFPDAPFDWLARHSLDFWLSSEDLPKPENRISYAGGRVRLELEPTNEEAHRRLRGALHRLTGSMGAHPHLFDRALYFGKDVPISGTAHQAGTMVFGEDADGSVLNLDCRTHEVENLYVADASFFPSIGAVNPTLMIVANALRVADRVQAALS